MKNHRWCSQWGLWDVKRMTLPVTLADASGMMETGWLCSIWFWMALFCAGAEGSGISGRPSSDPGRWEEPGREPPDSEFPLQQGFEENVFFYSTFCLFIDNRVKTRLKEVAHLAITLQWRIYIVKLWTRTPVQFSSFSCSFCLFEKSWIRRCIEFHCCQIVFHVIYSGTFISKFETGFSSLWIIACLVIPFGCFYCL